MLEPFFSWSFGKIPTLTLVLMHSPSLLMKQGQLQGQSLFILVYSYGSFMQKGVEIPQDISLMPTPSAINALTIARIKVRLLGDEEEGDQAQGEPMDTYSKVEGRPPTTRSRGKRGRASSYSEVPPDAFQIILERINGLRDIPNEHFDRLTAIQEQIYLLSTKFDGFTNQP